LRQRRITREEAMAEPSLAPHVGEGAAAALRDPRAADWSAAFLDGLASSYPADWVETAGLDARYEGYEAKEARLAARLELSDRLRVPEGFEYRSVEGLSIEAVEKLSAARPATLGQAARVPGVRRADAALLMVALRRPRPIP
jgi:tRNA uridine 5-carboxymethylaminomethyl modification enzyme